MILVMLKAVGTQVHTVLQTLINKDQLMLGTIIAHLGLVYLSRNTIEDLSADL